MPLSSTASRPFHEVISACTLSASPLQCRSTQEDVGDRLDVEPIEECTVR